MLLHSTNKTSLKATFADGIINGLAPDGGLYMPDMLPSLPKAFFRNISEMTLNEIAYVVINMLLGDVLPANVIKQIVDEAIDFDIPLVRITDKRYALELFHGPTMSFKDIGARCMARIMQAVVPSGSERRDVLLATSGDSGGAVADAFVRLPDSNACKVYVVYPAGELSRNQVAQFAALKNVVAIEVEGTFDDCQNLVKDVLLEDGEGNKRFTSGNSINLARELPSLIYFFQAYARAVEIFGEKKRIAISIPCGNLGSFCAALMAKKMGLPVEKFIAANNANDVFVDFLKTGGFKPRKALMTLAHAMDVGNPSNLTRIIDLYNGDISLLRNDVDGYACSDDEIANTIYDLYTNYNYLMDPQGATAFRALNSLVDDDVVGIVMASAHPVKSMETIKGIIKCDIGIPSQQMDKSTLKVVKIPPTIAGLTRALAR